ncbi:MAG: hypothetical protein QNJ16_11690 [Rhodobacter sp.]|nr:hypothetical protein [Rhodobacter sp.]
MPISEEEIAGLRARLRFELQDDLMTWFRARFWVAATVIAVVGFFGIRGVVQQVFEGDLKLAREQTTSITVDAVAATTLAETAAQRASSAADEVEAEIAVLRNEIEDLRKLTIRQSEQLERFKGRAESVELIFQDIEVRIEAVRSGAQNLTTGSIDAVLARVAAVETAIAKLAEEGGTTEIVRVLSDAREEASQVSEEQLEQVRLRSQFQIYPWLWDAPPEMRDKLLAIIEDNRFPITNKKLMFDPKYEFSAFAESADPSDLENLRPGTVVFGVSNTPDEGLTEWLQDLITVVVAGGGFSVEVVERPSTVDYGVIMGFKPL